MSSLFQFPRFRRFARDEHGNSTIEFLFIFPILITLLCSATESGMLMLRQVMLDRALDMAVRDLRIGTWDEPTHAIVKQRICDNTTVIPNCMSTVLLELREIDTDTWVLPATNATCIDRSEELEPVTTFSQSGGNALMLVRACAVFDPVFPGAGLGLELAKDDTGAYALFSASAFVNEPS